jgi:hypothetical protein
MTDPSRFACHVFTGAGIDGLVALFAIALARK